MRNEVNEGVAKNKHPGTQSKRNKKLLYLIVSALIAIVLWFYVMLVLDPDITRTYEIRSLVFIGEETLRTEQSLIIRNGKPLGVTIRVRGRMMDLAQLQDLHEQIEVYFDVSNVNGPGMAISPVAVRLPHALEHLYVMEINPSIVELTFERVVSEFVEIRIDSSNLTLLTPAHLLGTISIDPEVLIVAGPDDIISQIEYARIELTRTGVDATFSVPLPYTFIDGNGREIKSSDISVNTENVMVTVPVFKTKEVPLEPMFIEGSGIKTANVLPRVEPAVIHIQGDPRDLDLINTILLEPIDLREIIGFSASMERIIYLPERIQNLSEVTAATVTIELVGIEQRSERTERIEVINIPEGFRVDLITREVEVMLRGPAESVALVQDYHLRVVVDMQNVEGLTAGMRTVGATVFIDGQSDAAVLNPDGYSVNVNVRAARDD
jgi:YbbR domain-containing protein